MKFSDQHDKKLAVVSIGKVKFVHHARETSNQGFGVFLSECKIPGFYPLAVSIPARGGCEHHGVGHINLSME